MKYLDENGEIALFKYLIKENMLRNGASSGFVKVKNDAGEDIRIVCNSFSGLVMPDINYDVEIKGKNITSEWQK